ncbi:hypothetical protein SAMN02800694_0517 [Luteibacter sp. UNCMF331Sha3.1]|nr:hypothetical protein SAMN02800694_0517 [Luteibacter sp. UNCMF331Sha3.1]
MSRDLSCRAKVALVFAFYSAFTVAPAAGAIRDRSTAFSENAEAEFTFFEQMLRSLTTTKTQFSLGEHSVRVANASRPDGSAWQAATRSRHEEAVRAVKQLMSFLSTLKDRDELSPEFVGRYFGVSMTDQMDGWLYISRPLAGGWSYALAITLGNKSIKRGFSFRFYNQDRRADPTPVCLLTLKNLRRDLAAAGYEESVTPTEIGGAAWINFVRGDIDLIVIAQDLVAAPNGDHCLRGIATADG